MLYAVVCCVEGVWLISTSVWVLLLSTDCAIAIAASVGALSTETNVSCTTTASADVESYQDLDQDCVSGVHTCRDGSEFSRHFGAEIISTHPRLWRL